MHHHVQENPAAQQHPYNHAREEQSGQDILGVFRHRWASFLRQTFHAFHLVLPGSADMLRAVLLRQR